MGYADDELLQARADVRILEKSLNEMAGKLLDVERERDEARAFGDEAARKYNTFLVEGRVLRCAFCGEAYPPGTPPTQHETLTAHVMVCAQHPLRGGSHPDRRPAHPLRADARHAQVRGLQPRAPLPQAGAPLMTCACCGYSPHQDFCGCCGRKCSGDWCKDCRGHIAAQPLGAHVAFWEQTYFAVHGEHCPYQVGATLMTFGGRAPAADDVHGGL